MKTQRKQDDFNRKCSWKTPERNMEKTACSICSTFTYCMDNFHSG